jgi:hypothetical protein
MKKLWALAAVVTWLLIPAASAAELPQAGQPAGTTGASAPSEAAAALKQDMRKLWTDHVVWTRGYVIAALDDEPDAQAAANRLLKNQEDIGKAVAKFYGDAAGQQLTTLLKEHITIAVDLVKAAKVGDKSGQQQADSRWQQNAVQIAEFLSKANPNWPRATLVDMMKMHLSTTTAEVVARLNKNWEEDVRAFDAVYDHILKMSARSPRASSNSSRRNSGFDQPLRPAVRFDVTEPPRPA